ncbi:hypothetical protein [Actinomycetospora lemnae]|uniref:Uncharacterized protein n=1 Tax=Actinomycetospora lemnae TaxID=3019891 RepID=A0ABT5SVR1_9PSEU|nr:hypothetical protein [Actinomycetospora sp. DW7H6]MDD7966801.1 hypothetical protein [Actinomycetospora sp. DW7H6]
MMQLLDGTCFSHSGIAVRVDGRDGPATHLASALTRRLPGSVELGGVRWDAFEKFRPHRDLYTVAMPDDLRSRALDHLARFRPRRGEAASFSVVKLVTVAAALRSIELQSSDHDRAERLFAAARRVAEVWAASDEAPSYYCAELAATAYGRPFTRAEMTPPDVAVSGIGDLARVRWSGRVTSAVARVVNGLDEPRRRALARLLGVLAREDRGFLHHAAGAIASSAAVALRHVTGGPSAPEPLAEPRPLPAIVDPHAAIPYALVTPRMLWQAFGRDTIRRVGKGS